MDWCCTMIISWVRRSQVWLPSFNVKTTVLSGATCLVSNGNNISSHALPTKKARQILKRDKRSRPALVCCFACFAAYDVKGRQVATGNGASCPWQQYRFNVKTWWPNFVAPYSTDNRSKEFQAVVISLSSMRCIELFWILVFMCRNIFGLLINISIMRWITSEMW